MESKTQIIKTAHLSLWARIKNMPQWLKWLSIILLLFLLAGGLVASLGKNKAMPVNTVDIKRQDVNRFVLPMAICKPSGNTTFSRR
jgi:hypothetical protein